MRCLPKGTFQTHHVCEDTSHTHIHRGRCMLKHCNSSVISSSQTKSQQSHKKKRGGVAQSYLTLCDLMDYTQSMAFSRPDTGVGSHLLLQRIFPTQGVNPGLPPYRRILYHLSHQGNSHILNIQYMRGIDLPTYDTRNIRVESNK